MDGSSDHEDDANFQMSVVDVTPSYRRMSSAYSSALDDSTTMFGLSTSQFDLNDSQNEASLLRKKSHADDSNAFDDTLKELVARKEELDGRF